MDVLCATEFQRFNRSIYLTGKLMSVPGPQYFKAARSYALAAASSSSYAPVGRYNWISQAKRKSTSISKFKEMNRTKLVTYPSILETRAKPAIQWTISNKISISLHSTHVLISERARERVKNIERKADRDLAFPSYSDSGSMCFYPKGELHIDQSIYA